MTTTMARRLIAVPDDPKQHARAIAEAVDEAWHGAFGGSRIEVPVSVVAALALVSQYDPDGPDPAQVALRLEPDGFAALLLNLWTRFVVLRPDPAPRVKPLWDWLTSTTWTRCYCARCTPPAGRPCDAGCCS